METFSALLAICAHKGQWRGALMFSLICVWINGWVNNREAGDLRRYHTHYDVIVMWIWKCLAECRPLCSGLDVLRKFTILQNTQHDKEYSCNFIHVKVCRVYYFKWRMQNNYLGTSKFVESHSKVQLNCHFRICSIALQSRITQVITTPSIILILCIINIKWQIRPEANIFSTDGYLNTYRPEYLSRIRHQFHLRFKVTQCIFCSNLYYKYSIKWQFLHMSQQLG